MQKCNGSLRNENLCICSHFNGWNHLTLLTLHQGKTNVNLLKKIVKKKLNEVIFLTFLQCTQSSSARLVLPAIKRRAWWEIQNLNIRFVILKMRNPLLCTASSNKFVLKYDYHLSRPEIESRIKVWPRLNMMMFKG